MPEPSRVDFRIYANLNDFFPRAMKQQVLVYSFETSASVKDVIEAFGVPHPEVELILANGQPVDFAYSLQAGDRLAVYPRFATFAVEASALRPPDPQPPQFVLDVHLGQLGRYLRMFGFDTLYRNDYDDEELAAISSDEHRILLTRDRGLLKRSIVTYGYCLRTTKPRQQLLEIWHRYHLAEAAQPFKRCIRCNGLLWPVDKASVLVELPPKTQYYYDEFHRCQACGQIYWPGTHYLKMRDFIQQILS
jgi:hypothetical protein